MAAIAPSTPRWLGPYVLHGRLAAGGMGVVHLGVEPRTARLLAIKRLRAELAGDAEFVAMFQDEVRLAALVRHPCVVPTLGVITDGGEIFLVMEYVAGAPLSAAITSSRAPPRVALRVALDVLAALAAAHEAGDERGAPLDLVHRDVSPHNVLVGLDGAARLTDFGVARAAGRFQATTPGRLKGKLRYMAPELLRGAPATVRSDVYSVSVVLWEALTGLRLFHGDSYPQIFGQVLEGIVPPPSDLAPVSAEVSAVVLRGLSRDPAARFPAARAMAEALDAILPPAPRVDVAAWIERAAADEVALRRAAVDAVLRGEVAPHRPSAEDEEQTPTAPFRRRS